MNALGIDKPEDNVDFAKEVKLSLQILLGCGAIIGLFFFFSNLNVDQCATSLDETLANLYWIFDYSPATWQQAMIAPIFFGLLAFGIKQIAPPSYRPARVVVAATMLFLTSRYLLWRLFHTITGHDPFTLGLRLFCFLVEFVMFINLPFMLAQMMFPTNRSAEADENQKLMEKEQYFPAVDVLVPSYNEPPEILRRTIVACQAIDYPNKKVFLLDDTRRDEVKALCEELGCNYVRREDNKGAKAGNVNNALEHHSRGDLLAIFDADFLPTKAFLRRTVGFFMDEQVALVQTPQTFYNPDPVQRNLDFSKIMAHEEDLFFRLVQTGRDFFNASICHGTSFVVRRKYVDEIGGFATESISEDFFTAVKLMGRGHKIKYLNEPLSAGASAMDLDNFVLQRMRWAQGTLQILYCDVNPLKFKGLTFMQRFLNLSGVTHWIAGAASFLLLILPIPMLLFDVAPMHARATETIVFFVPYFVFYSMMFSWFTMGHRTFFFSDVYGPIIALQLVRTTLITLFNPFKAKFKVTQKSKSGTIQISWWLLRPLLLFLILYAIGFCKFLSSSRLIEHDIDSAAMILTWCVYNVIVLTLSAYACINVPDKTKFGKIEEIVRAQALINGRLSQVDIVDLDETDAVIKLPAHPLLCGIRPDEQVSGELLLDRQLRATPFDVTWSRDNEVGVKFDYTNIEQERRVFELIYSKRKHWKGGRHAA